MVQHISAFQRTDEGSWSYLFTQEWPVTGIRHQLSYTIPVEHSDGFNTGLGDLAINYRYQLAGGPEARTVMAPRLSLLLPTGSEDEGRGAGGLGIQGNFPLSLVVANRLVTHWNAGATVTPSGRNSLGDNATLVDYNLGVSAIWLLRPALNLLVEAVWLSEQAVVGEGRASREETTLLNPGIRAAFDMGGSLQVVPGFGYTIGLSPDSAEDGVFVYLSFEHPFRRQ